MEKLFFELIKVSFGKSVCLSHTPSADEWGELYAMAKKQSLVGVCFAGVQKLVNQQQEPSEMLYLTWMAMAAKIQQRNETVNQQCVALQKRLSADGFYSCILKGQGVAQCYTGSLRGLRQSGDVDVLLWKEGRSEKENRDEVIRYARSIDKDAKASEHHIAVDMFQGTEVEMHYAPAYFCNPFANMRFKAWYEEHREPVESGIGFMVPNTEFNLVFLLAHTFRHYMSEGVGLRQLMDYYFILKTFSNSPLKGEDLKKTLNSFNMLNFASAIMWVMKTVFVGHDNHNDDENFYLGIEPNERLGRKLLTHVMQGGNFGHYNTETVASKYSHVGRFINQLKLDLSLAIDYPCEALWSPISMIREFIRIRIS